MIKKIFLILIVLGNVLMAAKIDEIEVEGIKVPIIFEEDKRLPLFTMQFIFQNSGSIADDTKAGLAKFSSKVLNEGTKTLGSSAFAEALESKAIHISSSIGRETLVVEVSSLKEEFDEALKYFDMLLGDPNLKDGTIKKVKTTMLGEIARKENDFDYVASNELKKILFEGSVLANPSLGTIDSIKSIEKSDVEEFLRNTITTSKLIIAIGGDLNLDELKVKLKKIIQDMPKGHLTPLKNYSVIKEPKEQIVKKESEQAYIYFGSPYHISVNSQDYHKAKVAMFILGSGGFGSRIMEEIRVKKGLAYSAYARLDVSNSASFMSGHLQTKLESQSDAKKSIKEVIEKFVKDGVSKDELEQTKKFMLGSEPLRVEVMSQRLNRTFMEFYNKQELGSSLKELEKIENLTLKELNEFIKEHKEILDISFAIVTK